MNKNCRRISTPSPQLITARDAAIAKIEREEDATVRDKWQAFSIEWARRLCIAAEHARSSAWAAAWDIAHSACREARREQYVSGYFPQWFGPRIKRIIGPPRAFLTMRTYWFDHPASTKIKLPSGETIRCFITEPYPWFSASWMKDPKPISVEDSAAIRWPNIVGGDFATSVPADDTHTKSAVFVAKHTGCRLMFDRVAYHYPMCIRLSFVPEDHRLGIQAAVRRYRPRPIYEAFPGT